MADTATSGPRIAHEFDRIVQLHGPPEPIVSKDGIELTSYAVLIWAETL